jgi:hypothetical protein
MTRRRSKRELFRAVEDLEETELTVSLTDIVRDEDLE